MKQIPMTPELEAKIKLAVGEDVDPSGFAVFESVSLNNLPLPGKDGQIFEKAVVSEMTLAQMRDSINGGNTLPLIWSHDPEQVPKGRVFSAELTKGKLGETELRNLWYIDGTETKLIEKVNAASIDEVSVSFLASQILCSECGYDYRQGDMVSLATRTCDEGHEIGTDGVHVRLIGLSVFSELSLVSRGAAKDAKIVGKSESRLNPSLQQLAASGVNIDKLLLTASRGEWNVDLDTLVTNLSEVKADLKVEKATAERLTGEVTTLTAEKTELAAQVEALTTELTAAKDASKATELEEATAELTAAKTVLTDIFTRLATAAGEKNVSVPETIAELNAGIEDRQSKLTAILPVGGASQSDNAAETGSKFRAEQAAGFKTR
jgi:hypothetical protein